MRWDYIKQRLIELADPDVATSRAGHPTGWQINEGQRASLRAIAERLPSNGVIIADEVGMGKTRIAVGIARAVLDCGGRVAILVPPGLGYQWRDELHGVGIDVPPILRSLWQYFAVWAPNDGDPPRPWLDEPAVLISHGLTRWRLGANSDPWRWALLPQVYSCWRRERFGRYPRYYHDHELLGSEMVRHTAQHIVAAANDRQTHGANGMRTVLNRMLDDTPWPGALDAAQYQVNASLRPLLEQAIGLGLGMFDLVIIDEAHKSRGDETMLGRLLEGVVQTRGNARRIAMTATPVELEASQWKSMLRRIEIDDDRIASLVERFSGDVRQVRNAPTDQAARDAYRASAREFKAALTPYLLRRDKRQDEGVIAFQRHSGLPLHDYRREREIPVDPLRIDGPWRQVICAAEALSFATRGMDDRVAKGLRLTMGNGHGIATLMGQMVRDSEHDPDLEAESQTDPPPSAEDSRTTTPGEEKRDARIRWWKELIARHSRTGPRALLEHPAIRAAVDAIEEADREGEKVLVFGRFVRPLQQLVHLLNARAMLRCLEAQRPWPQSKITDDEWAAVEAAHDQLGRDERPDRNRLDQQLEQQYRELENRRRSFRRHLLTDIECGLAEKVDNPRLERLFAALRTMVENEHPDPAHSDSALALVSRSLLELLPDREERPTPAVLAAAFAELVDALTERDEGDADGDGVLDEQEAGRLWKEIRQRINEDDARSEGSFARLMYGETPPHTRRRLQLGFNRPYSWPRVLVSQSQVGREGLNLHGACRVVVLLHPEWNPGVVEQQIGRVDRVGSHWEQRCREAIAEDQPPEDLPRIEVRPLVFCGTYDEWNWKVLRRRWEDLRAQLHGVIIPPDEAGKYRGMEDLLREIEGAAPNFYPE